VRKSLEETDLTLYADLLALNATGHMAHSDEIANGVVFLTSTSASYVSGTNLLSMVL
jgi:3-oxoacyl-[acyl-carrier protein] reductase